MINYLRIHRQPIFKEKDKLKKTVLFNININNYNFLRFYYHQRNDFSHNFFIIKKIEFL